MVKRRSFQDIRDLICGNPKCDLCCQLEIGRFLGRFLPENGVNPEVRELYLRRRVKGDTAMRAWGYFMTKLLRQVYGVWATDTYFDPERESHKRTARETNRARKETDASGHKDISAPVEETGKMVAETPTSMEPDSCMDDRPTLTHCEPSRRVDQETRPLIDSAEPRSKVSMTDVLRCTR